MRLAPLFAGTLGAAAVAAEEGTRGAARLGGSAPSLVEAVAGLALVLALIVGLGWALRRFTHLHAAGKGLVRVLGGVSLGARERAVIVAIGSTRLLLGVAPGQVRLLHVLPADEPVPGSFAAALDGARDRAVP